MILSASDVLVATGDGAYYTASFVEMNWGTHLLTPMSTSGTITGETVIVPAPTEACCRQIKAVSIHGATAISVKLSSAVVVNLLLTPQDHLFYNSENGWKVLDASGAYKTIGLMGPQGIQGVIGPQGPQGALGLTGPQGPIGLTGPQGIPGISGLTGPIGPIGLPGLTGPQGATGPQGPQGVPGATGPPGPGAPYVFVRKILDQSLISSTSLIDDGALSFPVGLGQTWTFEIYVVYESSTAGDIKLSVAAPVGSAGRWSLFPQQVVGGGFTESDASLPGVAIPMAGGGVGVVRGALIKGLVVAAVAGTVKLQWAQNTSNVTPAIVHLNSYLFAQRVA